MRWLMDRGSRLLAIFDREGVVAWLDWGTLLGAERHRNIIPWDYDGDFCLLEPDYQRALDLFARRGGTIDGLTLRPDLRRGRIVLRVGTAGRPEPGACPGSRGLPARRWPAPPPDERRARGRVPGRLRLPLRRRLSVAPRLAPRPARLGAAPRGGNSLLRPRLAELPRRPERVGPDHPRCASCPRCRPAPMSGRLGHRPRGVAGPGGDHLTRRSGVWHKDGSGIDLVRVVEAEDLVALERAGGQEALHALDRGTFTETVWAADRSLWGRLWVGALAPGPRPSAGLPGRRSPGRPADAAPTSCLSPFAGFFCVALGGLSLVTTLPSPGSSTTVIVRLPVSSSAKVTSWLPGVTLKPVTGEVPAGLPSMRTGVGGLQRASMVGVSSVGFSSGGSVRRRGGLRRRQLERQAPPHAATPTSRRAAPRARSERWGRTWRGSMAARCYAPRARNAGS